MNKWIQIKRQIKSKHKIHSPPNNVLSRWIYLHLQYIIQSKSNHVAT